MPRFKCLLRDSIDGIPFIWRKKKSKNNWKIYYEVLILFERRKIVKNAWCKWLEDKWLLKNTDWSMKTQKFQNLNQFFKFSTIQKIRPLFKFQCVSNVKHRQQQASILLIVLFIFIGYFSNILLLFYFYWRFWWLMQIHVSRVKCNAWYTDIQLHFKFTVFIYSLLASNFYILPFPRHSDCACIFFKMLWQPVKTADEFQFLPKFQISRFFLWMSFICDNQMGFGFFSQCIGYCAVCGFQEFVMGSSFFFFRVFVFIKWVNMVSTTRCAVFHFFFNEQCVSNYLESRYVEVLFSS